MPGGAGVVGAGEIGRPAGQFGHRLGQPLQNLPGCLARSQFRRVGRELLFQCDHGIAEIRGQSAVHDPPEMRPDIGSSGSQTLLPGIGIGRAARTGGSPGFLDVVGNFEGRVLPIQLLARARDFFLTEGRTVGRRRTGLGRRAVADHRLAGDHRRLVVVARRLHGGCQSGGIVTVDLLNVPAAGLEASDLVVGCRQCGRSVYGNRVIVEQDDQLP